MANPGDTKERFGRQYVFLNPEIVDDDTLFRAGPAGLGTVGTWRLRVDDTGTPPIDGGGGGDVDLSFRAVVAPGGSAVVEGNLVYLNNLGQIDLASAASITTAVVAGMATQSKNPGELCEFTRNQTADIFVPANVVDGAPAQLSTGVAYFLSTTPGNWTTTPDTTTAGAVVVACGVPFDSNKMAIEIQTATVI